MVDKIGGSSTPSLPPQTSAADDVAATKSAETAKSTSSTSAPADNTPPPANTEQKGQTSKFSEFALAGMARAAQLMNFKEPPKTEAAPLLPTPDLLKRNDAQKESKPEIQELQRQVNQWRTENGKPSIKEDGFYGAKTEKAVSEFQKANGLATKILIHSLIFTLVKRKVV